MTEVRRRSPTRGTARVPIGVEKALYLAARDPQFRAALLDDRERTVGRMKLTEAERTTLRAVPRAALQTMIDRLRPQAHGRGRFARTVAAASVTLAASLSGAAGCVEGDDDGDAAVDVPPGDTAGDTADVPLPPVDAGGDLGDVPEPLDVEDDGATDAADADGADVPLPPMDAGGILPDAPEDDAGEPD
jgi:hypothetical protein